MPSHAQNKEAVLTAKVVAPTEVEAQRAVQNLHALVEDPETNNDVKNQLLQYERRLAMFVGDAKGREEVMRGAVAVAAKA